MQFKLPELGEGVHEGEFVKWRVKKGDQVKYDQPLCEIMTDKATVEIPSAYQGKVAEIHVKEGETVKVGQVLLTFEAGASTGAKAGASETPAAKHEAPVKQPTASVSAIPAAMLSPSTVLTGEGDFGIATRVLAAPSTRKMARELGVNLSAVTPSGPNGRVMREDVERAISGGGMSRPMSSPMTGAVLPSGPKIARAIPTGGEERVPFRGLRKKIAEKMAISKHKAAHFTFVEEADATDLVRIRAAAKEMGLKQGVKVTYLPFVMKAMVAALRQYPILNSSLDEEKGELVYKHFYNIGLSIQTDEGLTAPNVKNVESKTIFELARDIQELVERARTKRLTREDFEGGTITLTNAGTIGGLFATPVINYPEVAIVGFNKIFRKPVAITTHGREEIVIRDWTYFSISFDHRVVDGAIGAEFTKLMIKYIENPSLLLLEGI